MKAFEALRIVFMGTPGFAVASLDALVQAGANVVAVVTAPDKPAGRGMKLTPSAVKTYATEHQIPVLQPEKLKEAGFIETLKSYQADLQVVVAFRMLPEMVWNMPPMGTINVHGSLLPHYRGAAPINWAVINGEKMTGVTTFQLQHEIDTGNILLQESFPIGENDTAGDVHDHMQIVGANLLVKTIKALAAGTITPQPQAFVAIEKLKHAPKIFTETCVINFDQPVQQVHNHIRGLSPFPGAFTHLNDKIFKIYQSTIEPSPVSEVPGTVVSDGKTFLKFACKDGYLVTHNIQLEGKRKMNVEEFLRGYKL
ncbi:methionyl-tRNA formyltransferase [Gynurincola endophyticus]|uniref:methionyl-tRNA formyltransferase n=1 Tax=Gynurincola endophyticus TaxID=2479004 RepID=UPI001F00B821|nr:methionyl-tRNA formyltransferase [Gynurincola endophyticus]